MGIPGACRFGGPNRFLKTIADRVDCPKKVYTHIDTCTQTHIDTNMHDGTVDMGRWGWKLPCPKEGWESLFSHRFSFAKLATQQTTINNQQSTNNEQQRTNNNQQTTINTAASNNQNTRSAFRYNLPQNYFWHQVLKCSCES